MLFQTKMAFVFSMKHKRQFFEEYLGHVFNIMSTGASKLRNEKAHKSIIKVVHATQVTYQVIYVNNRLQFKSLFTENLDISSSYPWQIHEKLS